MIAEATTLDNFRKSLELKEDQIVLTELQVHDSYPVCNCQIKELDIPENVIISCIIRENHMIVPNGSTRIQEKDKLLVISSKLGQQEMIHQFSGGNE
nr:TrkA C-terminal domain-containing protein [Diplocloster modestus]